MAYFATVEPVVTHRANRISSTFNRVTGMAHHDRYRNTIVAVMEHVSDRSSEAPNLKISEFANRQKNLEGGKTAVQLT